jgi:hypothetical protein
MFNARFNLDSLVASSGMRYKIYICYANHLIGFLDHSNLFPHEYQDSVAYATNQNVTSVTHCTAQSIHLQQHKLQENEKSAG